MQTIRTKEEFTCQKCSREATVKIEFDHGTYILCDVHEQQLADKIREDHV